MEIDMTIFMVIALSLLVFVTAMCVLVVTCEVADTLRERSRVKAARRAEEEDADEVSDDDEDDSDDDETDDEESEEGSEEEE